MDNPTVPPPWYSSSYLDVSDDPPLFKRVWDVDTPTFCHTRAELQQPEETVHSSFTSSTPSTTHDFVVPKEAVTPENIQFLLTVYNFSMDANCSKFKTRGSPGYLLFGFKQTYCFWN